MKLTPEQRTAALATFSEYFVRNYPGPNTIISDPNWHAPKIFRAALHAIESESAPTILGMKVVVDPSMPPGTIEMRGPHNTVRVEGLAADTGATR